MPTIKTKTVIKEAVEIKTFIEKNKKLPNYCTIEGTYKCDMIVKDGECVNFTDCPGQCFGGY